MMEIEEVLCMSVCILKLIYMSNQLNIFLCFFITFTTVTMKYIYDAASYDRLSLSSHV